MTSFYRYPHIPHLAWLGTLPARNDKVLSAAEKAALLGGKVIVEEKLDGANLGLSLAGDRRLHIQNRGSYLLEPFVGQFARLHAWVGHHGPELVTVLDPSLIVFGEWLAARHSILYRSLPDWFVVFDVYDRQTDRFWCTDRRNAFAGRTGLKVVSSLFNGYTDLTMLTNLVTAAASQAGGDALEGIVVRRDGDRFNEMRAKLVRPGFVQEIGDHWRRRRIEWNQVTRDDK